MDYKMRMDLLVKANAAKEDLMEVRKNNLLLTRGTGNGNYYTLRKSLCPAAKCLLDASIAAQDKHLLDAYLAACVAAGIDHDRID